VTFPPGRLRLATRPECIGGGTNGCAAVTLKLLSGRSWDWQNRLSGWNDGCSDDRRRAVIGAGSGLEYDAADVPSQSVGVLRHDLDGVGNLQIRVLRA